MSALNLADGTRREDPSDLKLSSGRPLTLQPIDCFQPRIKPAKGVEYDADNLVGDHPAQGRAASIVCSKKSAFI